MKQLGYGKDYKYAHAYKGNFVKQDFLPEEIRTQRIWHAQDNPSEQKLMSRNFEAKMRRNVQRAQQARKEKRRAENA